MTPDLSPSFSPARKWNLTLNTGVFLLAILAIAAMVNYLGARHFARAAWSSSGQTKLSPRTQQVLSLVSNDVKIILYFDRTEPLYDLSWALLKAYAFANRRIVLEAVDYTRDPAAAQLVKARYQLNDQTDRDIVIFFCQGRKKVVYQSELSDLDTQALLRGESEVRRTHFKGEMMFTSALFSVINPRQHKAYFLHGHGEHDYESDEGVMGYSRLGGVLRENAVQYDKVNLESTPDVPADCNLLVIAGPRTQFPPDTLEKIDRYLKQGGRLLVMFNFPPRRTGLEDALADWGVAVGHNVVIDPKAISKQNDVVVDTYGTHPLIKPLYPYQLYFILPRSVSSATYGVSAADAPQVEPLFFTKPTGRIMTDIRQDGTVYQTARDVITNVPLAVAVEKGRVRNVSADRGATRIVVVGDSFFLANNNLDTLANRQFASQAINWLLARNELLSGLAPRPIQEYKLTLTVTQERAVQGILLFVMPGTVLTLGFLVWVRRRR